MLLTVLLSCLISECRDIISKMIVYEPSKRYTISKLREHSWMQKSQNQVEKSGTCRENIETSWNARSKVFLCKSNALNSDIARKSVLKYHRSHWSPMQCCFNLDQFGFVTAELIMCRVVSGRVAGTGGHGPGSRSLRFNFNMHKNLYSLKFCIS